MSILDHFTETPRPQQKKILRELERNWRRYDVFILRMPVGAGKSRVAKAITSWQGMGTILAPTNDLVDQYLETWPDLPTIGLARSYSAGKFPAAKRALLEAPEKVLNYHRYLAHRAYSRLLVVDEAHNLVPHLQDMEAVKLWHHLVPGIDKCNTIADLLMAVSKKQLGKAGSTLSRHPDHYIVRRDWESYRGKWKELTKIIPLTPRNNRPVFWPPSRVKKMVFLSATMHEEDVYDLGLEGRRVLFLDTDSPIPADRRPIVYDPVGSMSHAEKDRTFPALVDKLVQLLQVHQGQKGLVHAPYWLADQLRNTEFGRDPRVRFHTPESRGLVYSLWRNRGRSDEVLVGSAMEEGLDLPDDLCRWQVATKVQYPSMLDPAIRAKALARPEWYQWIAAKHLQQLVGRNSRHPDDYGVSYILDSSFTRLWEQGKDRDLFSPSFKEALTGPWEVSCLSHS